MLSIFRRCLAQRGLARRFPDEPGIPPPPFRGQPELLRERCRGHAECAAICPSRALRVTRTPVGWAWELDRASCLACGLCVEVCPERAIMISPAFELAARSRDALRESVTVASGPAEATL